MLPEEFLNRMKRLLGDEYDAFLSALEDEKAVRGLRINPLKCNRENFLSSNGLSLSPIPYTDFGFILNSEESIGSTPDHHSGRIYRRRDRRQGYRFPHTPR